MANIGSLQVFLTANTAKFNRSMRKAKRQLKNFGRDAKRIAIGLGAVGAGATIIGGRFVKMASDAEETSAKFNTVFKNMGNGAKAMAQSFAKDFGLASSTSQQLLGDTGDLLTGFGFAQDEALRLSDEVNRLAVDLASFTNFSGGAEGASKALTKALLGERESVKSLGISILEKDVKEQMAIDTANGLTFATERQAKAQATLTLAVKQSKNAIGDYARTQDGMANQMRKTAELWKELQITMGKFIMDTLKLPKLLKSINNEFQEINDLMSSGFIEFFKVEASFAIQKWWIIASTIFKNMQIIASNFFDNFMSGIDLVTQGLKAWGDFFFVVGRSLIQGFIIPIEKLIQKVKSLFEVMQDPTNAEAWKKALTPLGLDIGKGIIDSVKRDIKEISEISTGGVKFKSFTEGLIDNSQQLLDLEQQRVMSNEAIATKFINTINEQTGKMISDTNKGKGTVTDPTVSDKFAGAIEKGSVEAYSASLGAQSTDKKIEKNTDATVRELQEVNKNLNAIPTAGALSLAIIGV